MSTTTYANGRYLAEILEHGLMQSSAKNTPGFFIQIRILKRYNDKGQPGDCPQYERTIVQYLGHETGIGILKGDLKALGVRVTSFAELDPDVPNHVNLSGRQVDVTCELEPYEGRLRERWSIARPRRRLPSEALKAL